MISFNLVAGAINAPGNGRDAASRASMNMDRDTAARHVSTKLPTTRGFIPLPLWTRVLIPLLLFVFATPIVMAQEDEYFPTGNGDGSEGSPFQIFTVEELAQLATLVNASDEAYNAAHYLLMNDLNLNVAPHNTGTGWVPIGTSATITFRGTFDGGGNVIRGLFMNRTSGDHHGLFGSVQEGFIKNLGVEDANLTTGFSGGILVGVAYGIIIDNCYTTGTIVGNGSNIGGLGGNIRPNGTFSSKVSNSHSTATVSTNGAGRNSIGGLIGTFAEGTYTGEAGEHIVIDNCYATGSVTSSGTHVGGLAGGGATFGATDVRTIVVRNSYATGNVVGSVNNVGGLFGRFHGHVLENCYATGDVTGGGNSIGGLAGALVLPADMIIRNCYATGVVIGSDALSYNVGGIAGNRNVAITIANCAALNPSVRCAGAETTGRVIGNSGDNVTLANNVAFVGMTNIDGTTVWDGSGHDHKNGLDKASVEFQTASGFPAGFDAAPWTYEPGKLPGLNSETVDMPNHLLTKSFELDVTYEIFPIVTPDYTEVTPITATVTNIAGIAIGPLTIELAGENAESFELSDESIPNIAASGTASFTVSPIAGLPLGQYAATVKVTDNFGASLSFDVKFIVAYDGETGIPDTDWYDAGEPFVISFPDELAGLAKLVNEGTTFAGQTVTLANDIDLSVYGEGMPWNTGTGWVPIGTGATINFRGTFDGGGNVIRGLFMNRTSGDHHGLFGSVQEGFIKNLGVEDANLTTGFSGGILVGVAYGIIIDNCYTTGKIVGNGSNIGGLGGNLRPNGTFSSKVSNSHSTATVSTNGAGRNSIGGLIGTFAEGTYTGEAGEHIVIDNCYATGSVTSSGTHVGGLAGGGATFGATDVRTIVVRNSYATGNVVGSVNNVGGLFGRFHGHVLENCYATGDVTGGGNSIGGLAGAFVLPADMIIRNCYATGVVIGSDYVGGIAGNRNVAITIANCAALNPSVRCAVAETTGRVIGNSGDNVTLENNVAFVEMTNIDGTTLWDGSGHDHKNGLDKVAAEFQTASGFPAGFDAAPWTYEPGKLPGLNGETVNMPTHLIPKSVELDVTDEIFPIVTPDYTEVTPITATVTNIAGIAIGPLTIELAGENAESFELSDESIPNIAASGTATFTVSPIAGLPLGQYAATVKVTDNFGASLSFDVKFIVAFDGETGIPDTDWYDAGEPLFVISFPDELAGLAKLVNEGTTFAGQTVTLANDIDLSIYGEGAIWNGGNGWTPIGVSDANSFRGVFEGANKTITGLYINATTANKGLFGVVVDGEIKNLGITGASVKGSTFIGILAGLVRSGVISDCFSSGAVHGSGAYVGGLIGRIRDVGSSVDLCYSTADVVNDTGVEVPTGGLIGAMDINADDAGDASEPLVTLTNSYATGTVSGRYITGGLVGLIAYVDISACYATGEVKGTGDAAGGLIGMIFNSSVCAVRNCYATGDVTGNMSRVGGILGDTRGATGTIIENCYATGAITGSGYVGGIVGCALHEGLPGIDTELTNCIALNSSVKEGSDVGRVIGNDFWMTLSNNAAWDGIVNNAGNTDWGTVAHDNIQGASKTAREINTPGFFQDVFTGDLSVWTFDGFRLPGLKGASLDMPEYLQVFAQNPNIITHPQSGMVTVGGKFTLTVEAESVDNGTLTYQWYINDEDSNATGDEITGATGATYEYNAPSEEETVYFYVKVTNTLGGDITATVTSNVANIKVSLQQTYEVTVIAGSGATGATSYTAGATVNIGAGTPPANYRFVNWTSVPAVAFDNANNATTFFTMPAEPVTVTANFELDTYTATLLVNKDDAEWSAHGKNFTLKNGTDEEPMTEVAGVLTASVLNGSWKVFEDDIDTGVTIVINGADDSKTVNYYTISYSVTELGTANGSTISATYDGVSIESEDVVLGGKQLIVTVVGASANTYTYSWSGANGLSTSVTITVNAKTDVICTVTGIGIATGVENPSQVNPLKAWTNNGILHVSGIAEGKVWNLYSISGALVKQGVADSDVVTINLGFSGVYIIQSEGNTLKLKVEN